MVQISVIVPVYKAEKYLKRCIDSLLIQSFNEFELILVDDGSPDNSGRICDNYAKLDSRIKVIHQTNHGVGSARKTGLANSTGKFIIHADPDDWVEKDWLKTLYNKAIEENADMVICDYYQEFKNITAYKSQCPISFCNDSLVLDLLEERLIGSTWNKLIKKNAIINNNIDFDESMSYMEDLLFVVQLLSCDINVSYVNKALYHYDFHSNINSIVHESVPKHVISMKKYLDFIIQNYGEKPEFQEAIFCNILRLKRKAFRCGVKYNSMLIDIYSDANDKIVSQNSYIKSNVVNYCIVLCIKGHKYLGHFIHWIWKYIYVPTASKFCKVIHIK